MEFPTQIFKAYDVRGKVGTELTPEITERIGASFGDWLDTTGAIAVGYDMRPDSEALAKGFMQGLTSVGRDVLDIGQIASDMIYFTVGHFGLAGGAMITASHNPGDDNGIKMCREQARPVGIESGLLEIRDNAATNTYTVSETRGDITKKDVRNEWIKFALAFVSPETWPEYSVAIDAGNGMAGAIIPELEPHVPLKIDPMYFELDGTFPNHIANPLVPENLVDVQARIRETGADFGVAFDGDGDRAALIDENGQTLSGTVLTAILAKYFLGKYPGSTILYNAVCGDIVPDTVRENGGKPVQTKVGHSYIKSEMKKHDAVFGGEHSGHYYFRDNFRADSGLIAVLVAVQVLADSKKPLSALADEFRGVYTSIDETNFTVDDKDAMLRDIVEHFSDQDVSTLDGVTVRFEDGWMNVRPSNTEPLLRLNAEASSQAVLDKIVSEATAVIQA